MKRKVVLHGPSTLIISLPAPWVKRYGISRGDELDVQEDGRILKINPGSSARSESIEVDLTGCTPLVARLVLSLYHRGYDEITFTYSEKKELAEVERILGELIGFEIITRDSKQIIVKNIVGDSEGEFMNILRRLFLLVKAVATDAPTLFTKKDILAEIEANDSEINKLTHFCLRQLRKSMLGQQDQAINYYVVMHLELVADGYKEIARLLHGSGITLDKEVNEALDRIAQLFTKCYEFHFNKKMSTALEAARICADVRDTLHDLIPSTTDQVKVLAIMKSIVEMTIPIQGIQLADAKK